MTDIFHFEAASYLLTVDYTSRFLVVHKLSSMTGKHVASQCKLIFSEYGWPDTLVSDKWAMLHHRNFYKHDDRVCIQSYYKLPTLSAIQWVSRKVCPNCLELFLSGKRRGQRSFQKSYDLPQYFLVKQFTICNANLAKQECKIRCPHVKYCKKTTWFRLRVP